MFRQDGNIEWLQSKMSDLWLISGQAQSLFFVAALLQLGVLGALLILGYSELLPERHDPLQYESLRVILGVIGGAAALSAVLLLIPGMWVFWRRLDNSPTREKRFWFWVLAVGVNFGPALYYFRVYRRLTSRIECKIQ